MNEVGILWISYHTYSAPYLSSRYHSDAHEDTIRLMRAVAPQPEHVLAGKNGMIALTTPLDHAGPTLSRKNR
jgi:hypothetical protein